MKRVMLVAAALLLSTLSHAQPIELPSLSIEGSRLESSATFDSQRGIYVYEYTLIAAETNKTAIEGFLIDITGRVARPQLDPALRNNIVRDETTDVGQLQPSTTIPVGVIVPDPAVRNLAGPTMGGWVSFGYLEPSSDLQPGQTRSGFKLESKFPPAWRKAVIQPAEDAWLPIMQATRAPDVEYTPASSSKYELTTQVLAPYDLDETTLFLGGGQSPREVNVFLRYVAPTESRNRVLAATTSYDVTVVFGATANPATFSASLNGADITAQFRPTPGVIETVTIPLSAGTTKLQLSIEGTTTAGRTARDTDTLTFLVP